jgi:nicotinate-nucleotide--dimethylbenzimidazole phosphoribosyltransferase
MRVLVLGGIRSGKSEFAEALVADVDRVRYLATAIEGSGDPEWSARLAAHRARRPEHWVTEEVGGAPERLATLLSGADPSDVVLVDDLGGWLNATFQADGDWSDPGRAEAAIEALAEAVRACPAERLVLVTPEVGLTVMPATEAGRTFADANGVLNRRVAAASDGVVLVVAGQGAWLRGGPDFPARPEQPFTVDTVRAWSTPSEPATLRTGTPPDIAPGIDLPMPDDAAAALAADRLLSLDFAGAGLGAFLPVVRFAAGTQNRPDPRPWRSPRVLLLRGDHAGGVAAGDSVAEADRAVAAALDGTGTLALLATAAGAGVQTVDCPPAGAIETEDALDEDTVEEALQLGWRLAEAAVDEGADLIVLAACGSGAAGAAAAVVAVATGGEPAALLGRVVAPDGTVDDAAWMRRCIALRDARHRTRARGRDPRALLATLGGGDIAVAAGVLLGATARKTPVLIDGPVALAAGMVARDFGAQTRHWQIMPDHGDHPTVKLAADVLGVEPLVALRLDLGEGTTALTALPLLNTALTLAAATPERPVREEAPKPEPPEVAEVPAAAEVPAVPAVASGGQLSDQERIEAEIQRVITDSPTAELPFVTPPPGYTADPGD